MFSIFSNSEKVRYGQKEFVVDFESDVATLPTNCEPGSKALVIETSQYYMLNHNKQWVKVYLTSGNSGEVKEVIYNGGLI